jgi:dipeptidyl aminopeptidase/acylaminoacyl peptidase
MDGPDGITGADTGVKCVVAFFPATDLERLFTDEFPVSWEMRYSVRRLLGGAEPKDKPALARQASPIRQVRPGVAPHLVVHGGDDHLIPPQHSVDFVEQLLKVHVDAHCYVVGGFGHGNSILANRKVRDQVHTFLDRYLKPAGESAAR